MSGKPIKIAKLLIENYKRIKVISITPEGNVIRISGPNGSGKTSCLDAIDNAIRGKCAQPTEPVRKGAKKAITQIELDNGWTIKRTFTEGGGGNLTVEGDGARYNSPQQVLDRLYGTFA